MKPYLYLFCIALISAFGGLLFGYDWVVIGGAKPFYEPFLGIAGESNAYWQGWAMSSALLGCLVGALASGFLSDKFGRKPLLLLAAFLFVGTAIGTGAAWDFISFNTFRLIGGFAIGIASSLSPMYIAEISPASVRGRFVAINQLTIVIGILAAQIANWLIAQPVPDGATADMILHSWNGQWGWRWMFWAMTVPAGMFFLFGFILPESPRWLIVNGYIDKAKKVLQACGGEQYANEEIHSIQLATNADKAKASSPLEIFGPGMRWVLVIGVTLAVFQQWCGINVIFNYAHDIFEKAGYGVSSTMMNIVITGVTNLIFTIVAMFLVDKLGRKTLLLLGASGLTIIYALMGYSFYQNQGGIVLLILVVAAIACYAMTLAPVVWIVISEIYPNRVRGIGMSIAVFGLWLGCFLLTYTFPLLNKALDSYGTFWLYGGICLAGTVFTSIFVPETKGKSLEELEKELTE